MQQLVLQGCTREWPVVLQCSTWNCRVVRESGQEFCDAAAGTAGLDVRVASSFAMQQLELQGCTREWPVVLRCSSWNCSFERESGQ